MPMQDTEPIQLQVLVERHRDSMTVVGQPKILMPLGKAVDSLIKSGFMRDWFAEKIVEHLKGGNTFSCLGDTGLPKNTYRLATEAEILEMMRNDELTDARAAGADASERRSVNSRRKGMKYYVLSLPKKGAERDEVWKKLQPQGRTLLDVLDETGETRFTAEGMEIIFERHRERFKTKPTRNLMELFRFHLGEFFRQMGLVTTIDKYEADGKGAEEGEDE